MAPGQRMPYNGADCDRSCFLTWEQVAEMHASRLVEFASHSWQMHQGLNANPQGNLLPTAAALAYDPAKQRYETAGEYADRIRADLSHSADEIEKHIGVRPRAIAWPYGAYTQVGRDIAGELGMTVTFSLGDNLPNLVPGRTIPRLLVSGNVTANRLGWLMRHQTRVDPTRAVQVDLDYVYDPDPAQQDRNLSRLLDRIKRMHPSVVWLQAYADSDGDGVADAVYFSEPPPAGARRPLLARVVAVAYPRRRSRVCMDAGAGLPFSERQGPSLAGGRAEARRRSLSTWRHTTPGCVA